MKQASGSNLGGVFIGGYSAVGTGTVGVASMVVGTIPGRRRIAFARMEAVWVVSTTLRQILRDDTGFNNPAVNVNVTNVFVSGSVSQENTCEVMTV